MRINKIRMIKFKRFDDLSIVLGDDPRKIIALVGPNGCGKSSIFDAFEAKQKKYKGGSKHIPPEFFDKAAYSTNSDDESVYEADEAVSVSGTNNFGPKSFYIRSSYRFTTSLNLKNIRSLPDMVSDRNRPSNSAALDTRLQENYERLLGKAWMEYCHGTKSGPTMREELVGKINKILSNVVDIQISQLGDVISGKGQLYFEKGTSKNFPYENLSSGEKEVVDIIIDLVIKTEDFDETIYCIDEPELHLNTAIQRNFLLEIEKLIPDNCQLWIATHSIGFLRTLQQDLKDKCSVLDFSEKDYFNSSCTIEPMAATRKNWQRIFQIALDDLTGLLAPKKIIYCEGRPEPDKDNGEQGIDADVYNEIFSESHHDTLFVSSGGGNAVNKNASLALKVLNKAFIDVEFYLLKDRDEQSEKDRENFLSENKTNRMLYRREIENYLFDKEVLRAYCKYNEKNFQENKYDDLVNDIKTKDLKPIQQKIQSFCGEKGEINKFKRSLAEFIKGKEVYNQLIAEIFKGAENG